MGGSANPLPVRSADVDGIPVIWVQPEQDAAPRRLVIFLKAFPGRKKA